MLGLGRRERVSMPDDPLAPVLTRMVSTAEPVLDAWWMPGLWAGPGCSLADVEPGSPVDGGLLERMITTAGGAFDIVMTEPPALIKATAVRGAERDEIWLRAFMGYVTGLLMGAVAEVWQHEHLGLAPMFVAGVFPHPIDCCWPIDRDLYHAHCLVVGLAARSG
jgi:hypothetical protein